MPLGVYVSRCRGATDVLDLDALAKRFDDRAAVTRVVEDFFDTDVQRQLAADIAEFGLDALVLGGHSADHYERALSGKLLREALADAGVNRNRVIFANLLEQVARPHADDPEGAVNKASAILEVAYLRATMSPAAEMTAVEPVRHVLVLGQNSEAVVAAQRLLQLGFKVTIADRGITPTAPSEARLVATTAFVSGHPNTTVLHDASVQDASGWAGDFDVRLATAGGDTTVKVGGILLAEPHNVDWVSELRGHFRVDVDDDGRARSIHPAAHPSETVDPGIMVVPLRTSSSQLREKVSAADSAVLALTMLLSQPELHRFAEISAVDEGLCGGCASCVKTCAFGACYIDAETGLSHVDARRCRGCGKCVVSCPVGARDIVNSPHHYLVEAIKSFARSDVKGSKVLGFLCGGCGYPAGDRAGEAAIETGRSYPASFLPIRIPCGGRLDTLYVLEALQEGFDGVMVFRCREGHCHNLIGNLDMDRRMNLLRTVLRSRRLDDSRLRIVDISPNEGETFIDAVNDIFAQVGELHDLKGGAR